MTPLNLILRDSAAQVDATLTAVATSLNQAGNTYHWALERVMNPFYGRVGHPLERMIIIPEALLESTGFSRDIQLQLLIPVPGDEPIAVNVAQIQQGTGLLAGYNFRNGNQRAA